MHQNSYGDFHEQVPASEHADEQADEHVIADTFNPYGSGPVPIAPKREQGEASDDRA
jgi:hypothetical protein